MIRAKKGHPTGGLLIGWLALSSCGPSGTPDQAAPAGPTAKDDPIPQSLAIYRQMGHLAGDPQFAVVGGFVFLPATEDSTYAILALSLPNSALRFRREPPGFRARYRVSVVVGDTARPAARLDVMEDVRVRSFRETSRRDESVVFQGFMKLLPGVYTARVEVRDVNSSSRFTTRLDLRVPQYNQSLVTPPVVVYQAEPRVSRDSVPELILNPRATVELGRTPLIYVESLTDSRPLLEIREQGYVIFTDTLEAAGQEPRRLQAAVIHLDSNRLTPGVLTLTTRLPGTAPTDSAHLIVALTTDWLAADYREALSYLRYAGTPAELDSLRNAPPGERAQLLHAFWSRRDSIPGTPENEFFGQYFSRIRDANDRFGEALTPGWLTDRGAVYVTFGPPDEVLRHLDIKAGPDNSQVWLYDESLGFELRLVFTDPTGSGTYGLTVESRRAFLEAVQRFYH